MVTVSLCMIVKDEAEVLARCLESAAELVDEIVVVDTGSTDETKEIAGKFTNRIYDFVWTDDFSAARNYAFSLAEMDYCFWLDADDVLLPPDQKQFQALKAALSPSVSVVMAKYNTGFDGAGNVTFSYYRERLVKNHAGFQWKGAVHEAIEPAGEILYADFAVTHCKTRPSDPNRNLRIYEKLLAQGAALEPRQQFYYGRELFDHQRYREAMDVFGTFLEEGRGWRENNIDACRLRALCLKHLAQPEKAAAALLQSFVYDRPRAEICCELGGWFFEREDFQTAAYWYSMALLCPQDAKSGAFVVVDCYGFIPCLQLCVCYSRLGNLEAAERMNELAGTFKPDSPEVQKNRAWFQSIRNK